MSNPVLEILEKLNHLSNPELVALRSIAYEIIYKREQDTKAAMLKNMELM